MANVSFDASFVWQWGLPPFLPGAAANVGVGAIPGPTVWYLPWAGTSAAGSDATIELVGTGLASVGGNLPQSGTITSFRIINFSDYQIYFAIDELSLSASDFANAVAANRLSEVLLAGDDTFAPSGTSSQFSDGLRLRGFGGNDSMNLGGSNSFTGVELLGDDGDDTLIGTDDGFTTDTLNGGNDDDILSGLGGNDLLSGDAGEDRLLGGNGNDTLTGGLGRDMLYGGDGNDLIVVTLDSQPEGEILDGGGIAAGEVDLLSLAGDTSGPPQIIDLTASQVTRFERLELFGADVLMTVAQYEEFTRSGLYVSFELFGPVSVRFADAGFIILADRAWFGSASNGGIVRVVGSDGNDTIIGRGSADVATGGAPAGTTPIGTADRIDGGGGNDRVFGAGGNDTLLGGNGNDTLRGETGNDSLDGGAGNDVLSGGTGADALVGGSGQDTASYETAGAAVTASLTDAATNTGEAAGDTYAGIENLRGGTRDDRLVGSNGANMLEGLAGDDNLSGGQGNDTLRGGAGTDRLTGSAGADVLEGGADADVFRFVNFSESAPGSVDQILDFLSGTDRIDVSALVAGQFLFNGTGGFSGGGLASVIYAAVGGNTEVSLDAGDGVADMVIRLTGTLTLTGADFAL